MMKCPFLLQQQQIHEGMTELKQEVKSMVDSCKSYAQVRIEKDLVVVELVVVAWSQVLVTDSRKQLRRKTNEPVRIQKAIFVCRHNGI